MNHLISKSNREHSFDTELATIVGLNKAILLKNVAYWCEENQRRGIEVVPGLGCFWTEESLASLSRKYPYFTMPSISRWMNELNNDGWLRVAAQLGGKNLYSPGPVFMAWDRGEDWKNTMRMVHSQNENPPLPSQIEKGGSQNENPGVLKMRTLYNIDNIVTSYVEGNTRAKNENGPKNETAAPGGGKSATPKSQENETGFKGGARRGAAGAGRAGLDGGGLPDLPYHLSEWAQESDEAWRVALCTKTNIPNIDAEYYRTRVQLWSEQKGKTSKNWLATAAAFAVDDNLKNKLVTQKEQGHDQLIRNPLSGNLTTVANVNRAARAAERYLAKHNEGA